jgi:VWFA-related protein
MDRWSLRLFVLFALLLVAVPARPAPPEGAASVPEEAAEAPYFEQVTVRLVLLQATVLNRRGETVSGLAPDDFQVRENGVSQTISVFGTAQSQPLKIAFLLDISGSMSLGGRLEQAKAVINDFVEALRPEDQVALLVFADGDVVVETEFTTDRPWPRRSRVARR